MQIGGKYNWKGQPERLVYLGKNWSGNGYWHQFAEIGSPGKVWCEVLDDQLGSFEETPCDEAVPLDVEVRGERSMRQRKYVVTGGQVTSRNDRQRHYIGPMCVMSLHRGGLVRITRRQNRGTRK